MTADTAAPEARALEVQAAEPPAPDAQARAAPVQAAPASPPADAFIVVPIRGMVLFPQIVLPIVITGAGAIAGAQQAVREQRQVLIVLQRDPETSDPASIDMHTVGVVANILRYVTTPTGDHHIICQGAQRFRVAEFLAGWPYLVARGEALAEPTTADPEIEARFLNLRAQALEILDLIPQAPADLRATIASIPAPGALADIAAAYMDAKPEEKQDVLETLDLKARLDKVSAILGQRLHVLRLSAEIGRQTNAALTERQRQGLLREQLAAIQKELGEGDTAAADVEELGAAIDKAQMPDEVQAQARKELGRLRRTPDAAAEQERIILDALADLRVMDVREVMTPRVDVTALTIPVQSDDVARAVRTSGHSCFPVVHGDLDDLIGILFVNDIFRASQVGPSARDATDPSPLEISRKVRQPYVVPESLGVLEALADLRQHRRAFAVVVDEYGGVAGVLTIKDLLEPLVGDLNDEFDEGDEAAIVRVDGTRWLVDGQTNVDELRERLDMEVPDGEFVTLGGLLFDRFGHIPSEGEQVRVGDWDLRVVEMDKRRVAQVVATSLRPSSDARDPGESSQAEG